MGEQVEMACRLVAGFRPHDWTTRRRRSLLATVMPERLAGSLEVEVRPVFPEDRPSRTLLFEQAAWVMRLPKPSA